MYMYMYLPALISNTLHIFGSSLEKYDAEFASLKNLNLNK